MRRLPIIGVLVLLLLQLTALQVLALEKFGPHLSTNYDPKYLAPLRVRFNAAGTSDWVPLTVLIPMTISKETFIAFLDTAKSEKFLPIIRVWNEGKKILSSDIDKFLPTLEAANDRISGFPNNIFLVFGNEVNDGLNEWLDLLGAGTANPVEYASSLEEFITKVKSKNLVFKITNAPLNTSIPEVLPNIFDAMNFWNLGPKRLLGSLDGLTFNTYELGMADPRATISSWKWEYEQLGSPAKPLILTEFGFQPQASLEERENYVASEYQAYKNGLRPDLDKVLAITPLLWINGPIRIPIFSSAKTVTWIDPSELNVPISIPAQVSPTPASYFQTAKGKKVSDTLKKINQSFLPFGIDLKRASTYLGEAGSSSVLGDTTDNVTADESDPLADPAGRYAIGAAVQTPQQTPLSISSMIKNFFLGILGFFGFGNKKAAEFAQIQLPQEAAGQKLAELSKDGRDKLAQNFDSSTLGLTTSNKAMEKAVGLRQCANLPLGVCEGVINTYEDTIPTLAPPPVICNPGVCELGTGLCDPNYLLKYWNDPVLAKQASIICQKESNSHPDAINFGCLRTDAASRTKEYSVGLFQINLWNDACVDTLINKVATPTPPFFSCDKGPNFDTCTTKFSDPDVNTSYAFRLSGEGTNWTPWSAAKACGIVAGQEDSLCTAPIINNCPDPSTAIYLPNSDFRALNYQGGCIDPTMIVIHWSAAWTNVDATFNTLNDPDKNYACQLATDKDRTLQMQYLYKDQAQRGVCVGGYNDQALNNEITGVYFDEVFNNSDDDHYDELAIETEKSLASTCFLMKQYNIPITQIFGHFQLNPESKTDPGAEYLKYFLEKIDQKIKAGTCT